VCIYIYIGQFLPRHDSDKYICFLHDTQICKYVNVDGFFKQRYDTIDGKG